MQDSVATVPRSKPRALELVDNQTGDTVEVDWYEQRDPTEQDIAEIFEQYRIQTKPAKPPPIISPGRPTFTGEPSLFGAETTITGAREPVKAEDEQLIGLLTTRAKVFQEELRKIRESPEYQELEKATAAIERKKTESPSWQTFIQKEKAFRQLDQEIGFSETQRLVRQANETMDQRAIQEAQARINASPRYLEALDRAQELIRMQKEDAQIQEIMTDIDALAATSAERKDLLQYAQTLRAEYAKIPPEVRESVQTKETALMLKKWAREALAEVNAKLETADTRLSVPGSTKFGGAAGLYPSQEIVDRQSLYSAKRTLEAIENYRLDTGTDVLDLLRGMGERARMENIPFVGSLIQMAELNEVRRIANKPADKRTKPENLLLEAYSAERHIESLPGMGSMLYQAGRQVTDMFPYMVEFATTGGVYTAVKRLAAMGTMKLLGREAFSTLMRAKGMEQLAGVLQRAGLKATWATIGGTAHSLVNAQRIAANFTERTLPYLKLAETDAGELFSKELAKKDDSVIASLMKSIGTNTSEFVTERWGIMVAKPMDFIKRQVIGRYISKAGIRTAEDAKEAIRKGISWQGLFPEWFEEWVQMPIGTTIEEGKVRVMTPEEMLQTAIVVGVPSGLDVATGVAVRAADQRAYRRTKAEIAESRYIVEKAIERMMSTENIRTAEEMGVQPKMMPEFRQLLAAQISDRSAETREIIDLIKESGESIARFDSDYRAFLEEQGVPDHKINSFESLIDVVDMARNLGMSEEEIQLIARQREVEDEARVLRAQERILQEKRQYKLMKELKAAPRSTYQPIENIPEMPATVDEMRQQLEGLAPEYELVRMTADEVRRRYAKEARIPIAEEPPTPEKPVGPVIPEGYQKQDPGQIFKGTAYRSPSGLVQSATSVMDVLQFEAKQLGNKQVLNDAMAAALQHELDLSLLPSNGVVWVTRSEEDAKLYGEDVESVHIPKGSIVLSDIGPDGVLVLVNPKKLKPLPAEPQTSGKAGQTAEAEEAGAKLNLETARARWEERKDLERRAIGQQDIQLGFLAQRAKEEVETWIALQEGRRHYTMTSEVIEAKLKRLEQPPEELKPTELDDDTIKESLRYIRDYPDLAGLLDEDVIKALAKRGMIVETVEGLQLTDAGLDFLEGVPAPEVAEEKQPWQMTSSEWDLAKENIRLAPRPRTDSGWAERAKRVEWLNYGVKKLDEEGVAQPIFHRDVVQKAKAEGKDIPEQVRSEYPDLFKPEPGEEAPPEPTPPTPPQPTPTPKPKPKKPGKPLDPLRLHREMTKKRSPLPILKTALVRQSKMYSTDMETWVITDTTLKDGLYKFVGSEIVPEIEEKVEDYPTPPPAFSDKAKKFQLTEPTAIERALPFVAVDEYRAAMNGVLFELDNGIATIVGTDGHRMFKRSIPVETKAKFEFITRGFAAGLIAKDKSAEQLGVTYEEIVQIKKRRLFYDSETKLEEGEVRVEPTPEEAEELEEGEVVVEVEEREEASQAQFVGPTWTVITRTIGERFPDYLDVVPEEYEEAISFNKVELYEAIKTLTPFVSHDKRLVLYRDAPDVVRLVAEDVDRKVQKTVTFHVNAFGKVKISNLGKTNTDWALLMPVRTDEEKQPEGLWAGFNIEYLKDIVDAFQRPERESPYIYLYKLGPDRAHFVVDEVLMQAQPIKVPPKPLAKPKEKPQPELAPRLALMQDLYLFLGEPIGAISNKRLFEVAESHFKSKLSEGKWTVKDAYDILEAALNKHVIENARQWMAMSFRDGLAAIRRLTDKLPTQRTRTGEQETFQQFSTPTELGFLVASVGNPNAADVALEPSAGVGGLAAFLKAMGATVFVNELADRRAQLLKDIGFENVTTIDAEFLNDLLPDEIKPTLILMNPPFSATAGRVAPSTKYGAKHISQALLRLQPNGRLVALVGNGMAIDKEKFREWWKEIASKYDIRADISLSGEIYKKFGTTFDLDLIVIDNTGPTPGETFVQQVQNIVLGKAETLEQAYDMLKEVADERPVIEEVEPGEGEVGPGVGPRPGLGGRAVRGKRGKLGGRRGEVRPEEGPEAPGKRGRKGRVEQPAEGEAGGPRAKPGEGPAGGVRPTGEILKDILKNFKDTFGKKGPTGLAMAGVPLDPVKMEDFFQKSKPQFHELWIAVGRDIEKFIDALKQLPRKLVDFIATRIQEEEAKPKPKVEFKPPEETTTFAPYKPSRLKDNRLVGHPGPIVETLSMASVPMPEITYKPAIPDVVLTEGDISDIQYESVVYSGQRHETKLEDGARAGFFNGDGTGAGKGRINAAIILDNWMRGRKKALWVSASWDLFEDATRDLNDVMQHLDFKIPLNRLDEWTIKQQIDTGDGIIFTTYATLITESREEGTKRTEQLKKWLGKEPVLVFDEAHYAKNLVLNAGMGTPVKRALAVFQLQSDIPDARVVYSSATAATDVRNMAYMVRLGLWGPGTSFPDGFEQFMKDIENRGVGAMEMVSRDMKALGMYLSRTISFDGVEYRQPVHELTKDQVRMYDKGAEVWSTIADGLEDALEATNSSRNVKLFVKRAFWNTNQRFFRQLLMAYKVPTLFKLIDSELRQDHSVVIGLISTSEARDKEAVAKAAAEGKELDDLDFTPREIIGRWIERVFPIFTYVDVPDPTNPGKTMKVLLTDEDGNPVVNKEAKAIQERLAKLVSDIDLPNSAINQLILKYGPDAVAELTGRVRRLERDEETGKLVYTTRAREGVSQKMITVAETKALQSGQKRVAIISDKASQGISLHSDNRAVNKQRRAHVTLETGWSADKQLQQFGRTHRTDQAVPPIYVLLSTNVSGEVRFMSTIAKRLETLGALTKGQREAAAAGDLAKYNLESVYGETALMSFYLKILGGTDFPTVSSDEAQKTLIRMDIIDPEKMEIKKNDLTNVERFLNRLLTTSVAEQNNLFEAYWQEFQDVIESAKAAGTFDEGVVDLMAESIKITRQSVIHVDEATKAETNHYQLGITEKTNPVPWERATEMLKKALPDEGFYMQDVSGFFVYIVKAGDRTDPETGIVSRTYRKMTPRDSAAGYIDQHDLYAKYTKVNPQQVEKWWKEQFDTAPKTRVREHHIIAGAILPLWNKLRVSNFSRAKIVRVKTDDGQRIVGLSIPPTKVAAVLRALGVQRRFADLDPSKVYEMVMSGYEFPLAGGLLLKRRKVHGEDRVELMNVQSESFQRFQDMGFLMERIEWKYRFFVAAEEEKSTEVIRKLFKDHPPMDVDATDMMDNPEETSAPQLTTLSIALGTPQGQPPAEGEAAAGIPRKADSKNRIRPIEFVELVEIAHDLTGHYPGLASWKKARGMFYGLLNGYIRLHRGIFKKGYENYLASVLGHELGHLTDWLPDKTLKRGNLLGHLLAMRNFMLETYGTVNVSNTEIRNELLAVTQYLNPYPEDQVPLWYKKYRHSAKELYADAFSLLVLSPGELERIAPKWYSVFFDSLDRKPDVKEKFFDMMARLSGDPFEIERRRYERTIAMSQRGEVRRDQIDKEKKAHPRKWLMDIRIAFGNYYRAIEKKFWTGEPTPGENSPIHYFDQLAYVDNSIHLYLYDIEKQVVNLLQQNGISLVDFGVYMLHRRIANGDRGQMANPLGFAPADAERQLNFLRQKYGDPKYDVLVEAGRRFNEMVYRWAREGAELGIYSLKAFQQKIEPNKDYYATFSVLDYITKNTISPMIRLQTGTLKEVENPFEATMMKTVGLIRLIHLQRAKISLRDHLRKMFPDEIIKAGTVKTFTGKYVAAAPPNSWMKPFFMLEGGHLVAYHTDPYIAEACEYFGQVGLLGNIAAGLDLVTNKLFKPVVLTYNLGFSLFFNPIRDFFRTYKLLPIKTPFSLMKHFLLSWPEALRHLKTKEIDGVVREMMENHAYAVPFNEYDFDDRADDYAKMLKHMHVRLESGKLERFRFAKKMLTPMIWLFRTVKLLGSTFELTNKIAGYRVRRKVLGEAENILSYNTRNYTGTPNFRVKGRYTGITNTLFTFSNITFEGIKSDWRISTNPRTAAGYWVKWTITTAMPKLFMAAAYYGLFGDDLKRFFKKVTSYDLTNYMVLPWGLTEAGKAVYIRLPVDQNAQFWGAILWRLLMVPDQGLRAVNQAFGGLAGYLAPSQNPFVSVPIDWITYLSGANPYDYFRGRYVIADRLWQAGGKYALWAMVKHTMNEFGFSQFHTYNDGTNTTTETSLQVVPLLSRAFKITDYGEREALRREYEDVRKQRLQERLETEIEIAPAIKGKLRSRSEEMTVIVEQWAQGIVKGDGNQRKEAINRMQEFNRTQAAKIYPNEIMQSVLNRVAQLRGVQKETKPEIMIRREIQQRIQERE